jgi:hypothetical protein
VAYSFVASVSGVQTIGTLNTTGADLIVLCVSVFTGDTNPPTIGDSAGNVWGAANISAQTTDNCWGYIFSFHNPVTNAAHQLSWNSGVNNGAMAVLAFSGSASNPLDKTSSAIFGSGTTQETPGSVTPSQSNELCVAAYTVDAPSGSSFSIDSGYTIAQSRDVAPGSAFGIVAAYLIQTSAVATNPQMTRSVALTGSDAALIATFKAAGAAPSATFRRTLSPIGTRSGSRQVHGRWNRSGRGGLLLRDPLILPKAA